MITPELKQLRMLNRILVYCFYPLVAPLYVLLRLAIYKAKKQAESLSNEEQVIGIVNSELGQVPVTIQRTKDAELDFIKYRSPTYLAPMTWGVAEELAAMLLKSNRPKAIKEELLVQMLTETAGANLTYWDEKRQSYVADFSCFRAGVWDGYYQDVLEFEFNVKRSHYAVIDRKGNRYTPEYPHWNSCLLHVMCIYSIGIPMGSHNWIHFAFPDTIADIVNQKLPKDTFLYQLLSPHSRFTNRTNYQALWMQKSTNNYPDLFHHLIPWLSFPVYGKSFRDGVVYNTTKKYENISKHSCLSDDLDTSIPYFAYLKAYFQVIENFVSKITPSIEDHAYDILADYMESFFPNFKKLDRTRILSIFIWQVGIWHLSDHLTYAPFAKTYGFTEIRKPITEPFYPEDISSYNSYCLNNFVNIFVDFHPNSKLDQSLLNIDSYGFSGDAYLAAVAFRDELLETDRILKSRGLAFVAIEKHIQSVCF